MRLPLSVIALATAACVDTTLPDLSRELGEGRTDGPFCSPSLIEFFPPEELRMHIIDVGQGDAIWIQTPYYDSPALESKNVLIDAGPSGNVPGTSPGGAIVVQYMLSRGLAPGEIIHALVISHAHEDHYGGVNQVASVFEVARYVDPGFDAGSTGFLSARGAASDDARRLGGQVATPIVEELVPRLFASTDLFGEYVDATVLWGRATPPSGNVSNPSGTDINNTSAAFSIRWNLHQVLLLADLEEEVEGQLILAHDAGEINLQSNVLKVAHHGSSSSSHMSFLSRVFPTAGNQDWALISSGRRSFGGVTLPTDQTLLNLASVLQPNHTLSTENRDDIKTSGTEHNDDHIIVTLKSDGRVEACYAPP
ncbi:MAG: MBL fold metallo-hydrolase [Deltaproteobacteria bacterium]|nr:MBL fold metallo-hydrolase [Deltaproteobacteria bacterium]